MTRLAWIVGVAAAVLPLSASAKPARSTTARASLPAEVSVTLADVGLDGTALDRSVDPCSDFYRFACGGWLDRTAIPGDEPAWSRSFDEVEQRIQRALHETLEAARKDPASRIGAYYGACLDEAAAEKVGLTPLQPLLGEIDALTDLRALPGVLAKLHLAGSDALFDLSPTQDAKDATRVIANLDQGGLGLPDRDDYLRDDARSQEVRVAYLGHVQRVLTLAGLAEPAAKSAAREILALETALATVSKTRVERRDPQAMVHLLTRQALGQRAPHLDWEAYLGALQLAGVRDLNVTSPAYFAGMDATLASAALPTLRLYLRWHLLRAFLPALPKAFVDEGFRMTQVLTGQAEPKPRWRRCVESTDHALGEALGADFVQHHFAGNSKTEAQRMVTAIGEAFATAVGQLPWMDATTRDKALDKRGRMAWLIGFPDRWRTYDFAVQPGQYAANVLAARGVEARRQLAKIGRPVDRGEWYMSPPTVNAYYDPQMNQMVFPAGILQAPFFDAKHGVAVNLGGIGMVIGHELTHGFDDEGSQFDGHGNLRNWWSPKVAKAFAARTGCVTAQYDGFEVAPGVRVNGQLTLGENLADLGGVKLAFAAYRALRQGAVQRQRADGFGEDQQFFLAHAQLWCSKARPEYERLLVQTNPHAPARFRVNGPLADFPAFAEAFQCKPGAPMRPAKPCSVW
jgi:putative endopeptidase